MARLKNKTEKLYLEGDSRAQGSSDDKEQLNPSRLGHFIFMSSFPFLAAEILFEMHSKLVLTGLLFPFGFTIFWATYFTYGRPEHLEDWLLDAHSGKKPRSTLLHTIFILFLWVKKNLFPKKAKQALRTAAIKKSAPKKQAPSPLDKPNRILHEVRQEKVRLLPKPLKEALFHLGLHEDEVSFSKIHHAYRLLAKRYHPDLNQSLSGRERFIQIDQAFRLIEDNREEYFEA